MHERDIVVHCMHAFITEAQDNENISYLCLHGWSRNALVVFY